MDTVHEANSLKNVVCMLASSFLIMSIQIWQAGHAGAGQLVEALRYKPEGSILDGFIGMFHWNPHYGLGVDSASKRNEYQEYFLGSKAAGE